MFIIINIALLITLKNSLKNTIRVQNVNNYIYVLIEPMRTPTLEYNILYVSYKQEKQYDLNNKFIIRFKIKLSSAYNRTFKFGYIIIIRRNTIFLKL